MLFSQTLSTFPSCNDSSLHFPPVDGGGVNPGGRGTGLPIPGGGVKGVTVGVNGGVIGVGAIGTGICVGVGAGPGVVGEVRGGITGSDIWEGEVFS